MYICSKGHLDAHAILELGRWIKHLLCFVASQLSPHMHVYMNVHVPQSEQVCMLINLADCVEHLLEGVDQCVMQGIDRVLPLLDGLIGEGAATVGEEVVQL